MAELWNAQDMDPTETFKAMMEAYSLGMYDEATEHAENLLAWLNRDGFAPRFNLASGNQAFDITGQLSREICFAACRLILSQHEAGFDPSAPTRSI